MQVECINVYEIEDRLRKDKTKEGKEVWNYVKKLKEAVESQKKLTELAISKLKVNKSPCVKVPRHDLLNDCEGIEANHHVFDKNGFCIFCGNTVEQCKK